MTRLRRELWEMIYAPAGPWCPLGIALRWRYRSTFRQPDPSGAARRLDIAMVEGVDGV